MFSGDSGYNGDAGNNTDSDGRIMTGISVEVNKITDDDITETCTCSGTVTVAGMDWAFTFEYAFRGPEMNRRQYNKD